MINLITFQLRDTYVKFSTAMNCFTFIMVTVVLCNVLKLSNDSDKENVYISFLKEPYMSITIISKGRQIMSKISIKN